jgi:hypothetical protein
LLEIGAADERDMHIVRGVMISPVQQEK